MNVIEMLKNTFVRCMDNFFFVWNLLNVDNIYSKNLSIDKFLNKAADSTSLLMKN